jgi:hypothetical protein
VVVGEQVGDDRSTELPASAGDRDAHGSTSLRARW